MTTESSITAFDSDCTSRWSTRQGDLVLWIRPPDPFGSERAGAQILDLWETIDGDSVLITNRLEDLPSWFQLHFSEACGSIAFRLVDEANAGQLPEQPIETANLWRVLAGDYIAWIGSSRPLATANQGVLALMRCDANAAVFGEARELTPMDFLGFRAPAADQLTADQKAACRAVLRQVALEGVSSIATDWCLGD